MDKIKINIRYKTLNQINDECVRLEFLKNDGSPNKNAYLCTMLINFYPYIFRNKVSLKMDKIFKDENVSENCVFVEPVKNSIETFESIKTLNPQKSISTTIREIIEKFFSLESDERERIILAKNYDLILEKIKNREEIIITTSNRFSNKGFKYNFDPYKIIQTKDRIFNYVLGKMYGEETRLISIRLMKIKAISDAHERFKWTNEEKSFFKNQIQKGTPFIDFSTQSVIVKFTENGLKKLNLAYKNRPLIESHKDNIYVFKTTDYNSKIYFPQFGEDAVIISPSTLAEEIKAFFYKGYNAYSTNDV